MCWHGGTINLDEFKKEISDIKVLTFELFKKSDENSVYEAVLKFRDDSDMIGYGIYTKVLKNFSSIQKYILDERRYLGDEDDEEPIGNRAYWSVTKFVLYDDEYVEDITCYFSVDMKLLSVDLNAICRNNFRKMNFTPEAKEFENHNYLLTRPKNIDVPYKIGDILKINALPFSKIFYVVYGGERIKGEREEGLKNKWDCYYHWCIYESEDRNGLWIDDLSNDGFTDYVCFPHCPLDMCELVQNCPDDKIMEASKILKVNPQLWYEWISIKDKNIKDGDSNLEPWMFGGKQ